MREFRFSLTRILPYKERIAFPLPAPYNAYSHMFYAVFLNYCLFSMTFSKKDVQNIILYSRHNFIGVIKLSNRYH